MEKASGFVFRERKKTEKERERGGGPPLLVLKARNFSPSKLGRREESGCEVSFLI